MDEDKRKRSVSGKQGITKLLRNLVMSSFAPCRPPPTLAVQLCSTLRCTTLPEPTLPIRQHFTRLINFVIGVLWFNHSSIWSLKVGSSSPVTLSRCYRKCPIVERSCSRVEANHSAGTEREMKWSECVCHECEESKLRQKNPIVSCCVCVRLCTSLKPKPEKTFPNFHLWCSRKKEQFRHPLTLIAFFISCR